MFDPADTQATNSDRLNMVGVVPKWTDPCNPPSL